MLHGRRTRPCTFITAFNFACASTSKVAALVAFRPPFQQLTPPNLWTPPPSVGASIGSAVARQCNVTQAIACEHPRRSNWSGNLAWRRQSIRVFRASALITLCWHTAASAMPTPTPEGGVAAISNVSAHKERAFSKQATALKQHLRQPGLTHIPQIHMTQAGGSNGAQPVYQLNIGGIRILHLVTREESSDVQWDVRQDAS